MPGYLVSPTSDASNIPFVASGNISANNLQSAIEELDAEKTNESYVDAEVSAVDTKATSAKTIALLGL